MNLVTFPNESYVKVKVGWLDPQALPGQKFIINEGRIKWHKGLTQVGNNMHCCMIFFFKCSLLTE